MKAQTYYVGLVALLLVAGAAGCAAPTSPPPPTQTAAPQPAPTASPPAAIAIVTAMVERLNAGDVDGSMAYFAPDAMGYIVGLPPTGMEVYAGQDQIRALWQASVDNHFAWEIEITQVVGEAVYVQAKTWHDFTRQIGVAPLEWQDVYEVKDGKIVTYGTTITDEALVRLKAALAAAMPPEPTVPPPAGLPVSEITATIADGTCTTDSPAALRAGEVHVTLDVQDSANTRYALTVFNLEAENDLPDLMASTVGLPPAWADTLLLEELSSGQSATYTLNVERGPVYLICWSQPPDLPIGNAGPLAVLP